MTELDDALDLIGKLGPINNLRYELRTLRAAYEWGKANCGINYADGDTVVICSSEPRESALRPPANPGGSNGWKPHADKLKRGTLGRARDLGYNHHRNRWEVLFQPHDDYTGWFRFDVRWLQHAKPAASPKTACCCWACKNGTAA